LFNRFVKSPLTFNQVLIEAFKTVIFDQNKEDKRRLLRLKIEVTNGA